jgi:hypothetical protein
MKELRLREIRVRPENKIIPTENIVECMKSLTGQKFRWS